MKKKKSPSLFKPVMQWLPFLKVKVFLTNKPSRGKKDRGLSCLQISRKPCLHDDDQCDGTPAQRAILLKGKSNVETFYARSTSFCDIFLSPLLLQPLITIIASVWE